MVCNYSGKNWRHGHPPREHVLSIRLVNSTAGGGSEFGRSVSGCPGGGRKFGDSTDWKITQSRQDGTQIVADRDFEAPAGCDQRDDRCNTRPSLLASDVDPVLPSEL